MMGLAAFLWALRSGQFDDLEGAKWRAISDDNDRMATSERNPADDV
jgi:cbb3-type cytochrome oxidase maturation protein